MSRTLSPATNLDHLRREAKRWLKAIRAGDATARTRLITITPQAPSDVGLRHVQLALAREYGLPGWADLKQAVADLELARQSQASLVDTILRAAWDGGDRAAAARILARWPDAGAGDFLLDLLRGRTGAVARRLTADPDRVKRKAGPLNWEPLLYLAYARLPGGAGVEMARLLLDHGADPDARFDDGWGNAFTVLTGVIGQGEGDRPPHPDAHALATLLVERGADPFDAQALYNISICRDETDWLDFIWWACAARGLTPAWTERLEKPRIGGRFPLPVIDYLLGNAVAYNHLRRAEWLLLHGADAGGVHAYSGRPLSVEALVYGHRAMADLLRRHGAPEPDLSPLMAFQVAAMALDRDQAHTLALAHPQVLQDPAPLHNAAQQGRVDVVELLLDLGMPVDLGDTGEQRAIQYAVMGGRLEVVKLLVARGADIDRPTATEYGGGAMGFAAHFARRDIAAFLAPLSREVSELVYLGMTDRLADLFTREPELVNAPHPKFGVLPLFALPEGEEEAAAMAELLLSWGADPGAVDQNGVSAEQAARGRGLIDAADLIREAAETINPARNPAPRR
ncbi:ankyrin repeat domain-containing protein [Niveispirillum sp.]|uniref:ankyrin repeat domain-containing protein n=1 Tax=Niveispirillum sp. TaxID=1917217 RepID=UPI001B5C8AA1|nr:ankyrin repeat domain-containing protein [Niveispirillum sp.]MBP7336611.1 ankyrin repeat domain-containing protein [Niveispirillum sp.]